MNLFNNASRAKGSVLVFSLVILAFSLISALSIAAISSTDRTASFATEKSSRSFQVADSGMEVILYKIYKENDVASPVHPTLENLDISCDQGEITGVTDTGGTYTISFYDKQKNKFTNCTAGNWRTEIIRIKSEGTSGNTTRAVEVGLSAFPTP